MECKETLKLQEGGIMLLQELAQCLNIKYLKRFNKNNTNDLKHTPTYTNYEHYQGSSLIRKIYPTSNNGHKFITTTIEYFTKCIEAIQMMYIIGKQITKFILNYIMC